MIKRPLVSEKSMAQAKNGLYTFEITLDANKNELTKLIEKKFSVDVVSIKTITIKGKKKTQRRVRRSYFTPDVKKALVQVKSGQKIALFETINEQPEEEVEVRTVEGEKVATVKEKKSFLKGTKVKIERDGEEKNDQKKGDK